ncbi:mitochondrial 54S ribosomal mL60 domain-containing protein [Aspergillus thermomutatus]|uniref:54S ribosomal protein L31, mitochondrial n=1 Tax=Aspergillus thermomutatus TaxID=41047 RepID=A0A397G7L4_ASPTH|nr:uncharacterized protein CDV56_102053 [Aspergillus thermomutatus]RHZ45346.1 hypothetical protein CDV56_102053 [Aspergillus thermomutatus]
MFKASSPLFSGLLWKIPWRISQPQKARQRKRLRAVDRVVDTLSAALRRNGQSTKAVDRWYAEMPREEEMLPKDKYTLFDKKEKTYRKGIHSTFVSALSLLHSLWKENAKRILLISNDLDNRFSPVFSQGDAARMLTTLFLELPKWTRVSQRLNPPGF